MVRSNSGTHFGLRVLLLNHRRVSVPLLSFEGVIKPRVGKANFLERKFEEMH